ncbi:hypothetical protein ACOSQ3_003972 [Xanthoceras sorbifolium]
MRGWFEMFKGGQKSTKPNGTGPNVPPVGLAVRRRCPLVAARLVLAALPLAVTGRRCRFAACYYFVVLSVNGPTFAASEKVNHSELLTAVPAAAESSTSQTAVARVQVRVNSFITFFILFKLKFVRCRVILNFKFKSAFLCLLVFFFFFWVLGGWDFGLKFGYCFVIFGCCEIWVMVFINGKS